MGLRFLLIIVIIHHPINYNLSLRFRLIISLCLTGWPIYIIIWVHNLDLSFRDLLLDLGLDREFLFRLVNI